MKAVMPKRAGCVKERTCKLKCFCGALLEVARGSLTRSLEGGCDSGLRAVYHITCSECGNIHEVGPWWDRSKALQPHEKDVPVKVLRPAEASPRKRAQTLQCHHCKNHLEEVVPLEVAREWETYQDECPGYVYYTICCVCDARVYLVPWWLKSEKGSR